MNTNRFVFVMLTFGILLLCASYAFGDPRWVTPPLRYVHHERFDGKVTVIFHRAALEWFDCGGLVYGCAFLVPGYPRHQCIIHVWKKAYNRSLYRHELAHCNGWPYWHPLP